MHQKRWYTKKTKPCQKLSLTHTKNDAITCKADTYLSSAGCCVPLYMEVHSCQHMLGACQCIRCAQNYKMRLFLLFFFVKIYIIKKFLLHDKLCNEHFEIFAFPKQFEALLFDA